MHNSKYDNSDTSDNAHHDKHKSDENESLTHELLTEDELRYFSGQKKKTTSKRSVLFPKRDKEKTKPKKPLNYDAVNAITEDIANNKSQSTNKLSSKDIAAIENIATNKETNKKNDKQINHKLVADKPSHWLTKQGSGLQIIIASIALVLLVSAAVIYTLKSNDHLPTVKNTSATAAINQPLVAGETTTDTDENAAIAKEISAPVSEKLAAEKIVAAENAIASSVASVETDNKDQSNLADAATQRATPQTESSIDPLTTKQNVDIPKEAAKEQAVKKNDKQATVSYEDFAKEAENTLYRDSDY